MTDTKRTADDRFARFKEHLRAQRLKSTAQRDTIVKAFLSSQRHISVEELYNDVRRLNPHIGYATVYRTMKLLTECGVAAERHFRDGEARYESAEKKSDDSAAVPEQPLTEPVATSASIPVANVPGE